LLVMIHKIDSRASDLESTKSYIEQGLDNVKIAVSSGIHVRFCVCLCVFAVFLFYSSNYFN
jgi:hypothetical protein